MKELLIVLIRKWWTPFKNWAYLQLKQVVFHQISCSLLSAAQHMSFDYVVPTGTKTYLVKKKSCGAYFLFFFLFFSWAQMCWSDVCSKGAKHSTTVRQQNKTLPLKDGFLSRLSRTARSVSRAVVLGDDGPRTSKDLCRLKQDSFSRCMSFIPTAFSSVEQPSTDGTESKRAASMEKRLVLTLRKIRCKGDSPFSALLLIIGVTAFRARSLEKENMRTAGNAP